MEWLHAYPMLRGSQASCCLWLQAKVEGTTRARRAYDRLELIPDVFEIIAAVTAF